jgi:large conductance mechanosensitive channel
MASVTSSLLKRTPGTRSVRGHIASLGQVLVTLDGLLYLPERRPMLKGFKDFLMRGNVVDLAVAVVIGATFAKVVGGLLQGVINPLIASVAGKPNLDSVGTFTLNQAKFSIGLLLIPLVNFVCVGAGIYFMVVMPLNKLAERRARGVEPKTEAPSEEVALLTEIRDSMQARSRASVVGSQRNEFTDRGIVRSSFVVGQASRLRNG